MMAKLIGLMGVNFINSNGEEVKGINIFTAFEDKNVQGLRTEKFFVKADITLPKDTKINDTLNISFNHKGKIESIEKA